MTEPRRSEAGFTLVELLISMAIMAVLMLIAAGPLANMMHRGKIEGTARKTATLMQLARFEAIKRGVPARVVGDEARDEVFAYVDLNNNGAFDAATDRELGRYVLPNGVSFQKQGEAAEGPGAMLNTLGPAGTEFAEFTADGTVTRDDPAEDSRRAGLPAIRFSDRRENYLEVRVAAAASGRVEVCKWQNGDYYVQGENNEAWVWN